MSWDLAITLFFVITSAFALVIGRARVILVLLSAYVGIAVAVAGGKGFHDFIARLFDNAELFVSQSVLFGLITLGLALWGEFSVDGGGPAKKLSDTVITGGYGFLLAGLSLSTVFSFMSTKQFSELVDKSQLALKVDSMSFWWLFLPVVLMMSTSFLSKAPAPKE